MGDSSLNLTIQTEMQIDVDEVPDFCYIDYSQCSPLKLLENKTLNPKNHMNEQIILEPVVTQIKERAENGVEKNLVNDFCKANNYDKITIFTDLDKKQNDSITAKEDNTNYLMIKNKKNDNLDAK